MVFTKRLREGVRLGRITCSVRIWMHPHVKAGGRYPMDEGHIVVDSITPIRLSDVTRDLAGESGFSSVKDLLQIARHGRGKNVYLIRFHYLRPGAWDVPASKSAEDTNTAFFDFAHLIVGGDIREVSKRLSANPALATISAGSTLFLENIAHHVYAGDTALHIASAAFQRRIAERLIARGADCRARNRRGAEPLHYAADANRRDPKAQAETIEYLLSVGADPAALDKSGVAPLHRAVRTRSLAAVRALLDGGANVRQPNKSGSTPLHLAVQTTGKGGSGTPEAREQQAAIVRLLLQRGARTTDRDGRGKSAHQASTSDWIRALLNETRR